jgi:hypothetical protein
VGASSAQADAVDEWNDVAATITMSPAPAGTGTPVPVAVFDLATVSAAMYDAANAIDGSHAPFRARPVVKGRASLDAAVAAAARDTLVGLFPAFTGTVDPPLRGVAGGDSRRAREDRGDRGRPVRRRDAPRRPRERRPRRRPARVLRPAARRGGRVGAGLRARVFRGSGTCGRSP